MKELNYFSYGHYSSSNHDVKTLAFEDGKGNTFYFSYKTLVAFKTKDKTLIVRENIWGPTTGKHLNWIDGGDKESRLSEKEFEKKYHEIFG